MASWTRNFDTGSYTGNWHLQLDYNLNSQNVAGNYSNISLNLYAYSDSGSYSQYGTWDARLYVNGGQVSSNGSTQTIAGTGRVLMSSWSGNVGHNGDGTLYITIGDFLNAPVNEALYAEIGWTLPTINRYAAITSYTQSPVTDEAITINWNADSPCDYVTWWSNALDGGGHHDTYVGSSTGTFSIVNHNLTSNKTYDFTIGVRRQDSGLWSFSGTANITTLPQNGYFNTMGL